jgi:hypothetical protein
LRRRHRRWRLRRLLSRLFLVLSFKGLKGGRRDLGIAQKDLFGLKTLAVAAAAMSKQKVLLKLAKWLKSRPAAIAIELNIEDLAAVKNTSWMSLLKMPLGVELKSKNGWAQIALVRLNLLWTPRLIGFGSRHVYFGPSTQQIKTLKVVDVMLGFCSRLFSSS